MNTAHTRNLVAHYQDGNSDKIYIVSVRELPGGHYEVLTKWGRRHCRLIQLIVKGSFKTLAEAERLMEQLFASKLVKGYNNICSPTYAGGLTWAEVDKFLEPEPTSVFSVPSQVVEAVEVEEEEPQMPEPKPRKDQRLVVKCVNNLGLEHRFVVDAEYDARTTNDLEMLKVTDLTGEETEVFAERFEKV